ncbi:MAG: type II toxin-antitoxin system PemK/MazF family toxin [Proteiniphilum sp.]|uniref:type II toxin-antitoxin system PemK/MazF family toxin n=1 Tax=Proteiniphilum sp. TaxID=1926877 RepID=UPI002B1FC6D3|nr:type II toxin-antitoxin system PemK/MazF family toxin [Proteiniphilum sp.]MEA5129211.1 type II toxin-antitoxin system PemK/MazF family toxin [Proteiniphilum sp.]
MKKGDIVLVSFPFTDFSGNKVRPALVLSVSTLDVIVAFISTQLHRKEQVDIELDPSSDNGLKRVSIIKVAKLVTIEKKLVLGLLGKLDDKKLSELDKGLKKIFQLS